MPDVSIYVAVIAAGAGVLGASIPQVAMFARDARRDERDRRERRAETRRQACLDLLRAGGELRTRLANAAQNHGTEFKAGLVLIRESAAAVQLHAVSVALLAPDILAGPADRLAAAASRLAATAAADTDREAQEMVRPPDFTVLDECVEAFRQIAVASTGE